MEEVLKETSWQERYHASEIYTLRCKVADQPGKLGTLISAIGSTNSHVGSIQTVGIESHSKIRDIQVFCSDGKHLQDLLDTLSESDGVDVLSVRNDVLESHRRGTIEMVSRVPIRTLTDLRKVYTPGVASVCNEIVKNPESAWELTGLCDRVAIVTNGTAVLGLGNIGIGPSLPVMEGKSSIFSQFAGISAIPILIDSQDPQVVIDTVCRIAPSFGAIQLEDISAPACFEIEEELDKRLNIPVLHDDQHGTAIVTLAALINAIKRTRRTPADCSAIILGAGAAGVAIAKILMNYGIQDIVVYDSFGPLYRGRTERMNPHKQKLAEMTNPSNLQGDLMDGFRDRDIFVGVAKPNMVSKEMISVMAQDALVLPLSNPVGEICTEDALAAGAAVAADGRVINNALAYPGLFRGALDSKARSITSNMQLAAASTLAKLAAEGTLLPDMLDMNTHQSVARAVAQAAD